MQTKCLGFLYLYLMQQVPIYFYDPFRVYFMSIMSCYPRVAHKILSRCPFLLVIKKSQDLNLSLPLPPTIALYQFTLHYSASDMFPIHIQKASQYKINFYSKLKCIIIEDTNPKEKSTQKKDNVTKTVYFNRLTLCFCSEQKNTSHNFLSAVLACSYQNYKWS